MCGHGNAMRFEYDSERRRFIRLGIGAAVAVCVPPLCFADVRKMDTRPIPGAEERIPVIGLGTSDEFESMPRDGGAELVAVLSTLLEYGGSLVDTAPGYGDAEQVVGQLVRDHAMAERLFLSTKVRTRGGAEGLRSMARSEELLGKSPLDLMMVHSLVDAETQLDNLQRLKEEGRVRYIGITTSRQNGFERMEALIRRRRFDFIQVNYSPLEPAAAERVIPAAHDRGVAVMINRAFANGRYFSMVRGRKLPDWAADFDCESFAQLSLKYILGHPDVSCVLAATSNPAHMADNAAAGSGRLPDPTTRRRIESWLA